MYVTCCRLLVIPVTCARASVPKRCVATRARGIRLQASIDQNRASAGNGLAQCGISMTLTRLFLRVRLRTFDGSDHQSPAALHLSAKDGTNEGTRLFNLGKRKVAMNYLSSSSCVYYAGTL